PSEGVRRVWGRIRRPCPERQDPSEETDKRTSSFREENVTTRRHDPKCPALFSLEGPGDGPDAGGFSRSVGLSRGEPLADRVLRQHLRLHELEQVVRPAGLRADARHPEAAERLAPDQPPRAPPGGVAGPGPAP